MFLFIDNYDSFSYNLVQSFYQLGFEPTVFYNDDPALLELATRSDLEMVCISPGPGNPKSAGHCLEFLKRLNPQVPVLGVCLGHQILGEFAGAEVLRAPYIFHGKTSEIVHDGRGLFAGISNPMLVGRYHSLVVKSEGEETNPMFQVTARGPEGEVMALRYHDRPWVGVQFHPESVLTPEGMRLLSNFPGNIQSSKKEGVQIRTVLNTLAEGKDLTSAMAASAFDALIDGKLPLVQAGSLLMGLRVKGESAIELAQAARTALAKAVRVEGIDGDTIDIVGTGGDGRDSFNCSTAAALTVAGMGYKVLKHGNRAITSKCGSADVLERLGIPLDTPAKDVPKELERRNFVFLFAPLYHPAFRNIAPIRQDLGVRTIFNLLGPLLNPSRPSHILVGVARPELLLLMAEALRVSNVKRAAVVCGAGGYDELTPIGPSRAILLVNGEMEEIVIDPAEFGIAPCTEEDLRVSSPDEAEQMLRRLFAGNAPRAVQDMVMLNVGLALYLLEAGSTLAVCMAKAREGVLSCAGRRVLHAS